MDQKHIIAEITALKSLLVETDYVGIKVGEGSATHEEYAEILAKRQSWRDKINELEAMMTEEVD